EQIDAIRLQALQARFGTTHDSITRRAAAVRPRAHRESELRRQHNLIAPLVALEPRTNHAFTQPVLAVDVGRVDEVYTQLQRAVEHRVGGTFIHTHSMHE